MPPIKDTWSWEYLRRETATHPRYRPAGNKDALPKERFAGGLKPGEFGLRVS